MGKRAIVGMQTRYAGLLTYKLYAGGKGAAYSYTPDGKLATRAWARGVTTTNTYAAAGSLTNIVYSDDTPDVTFTYDRLGRQKVAQTFLAAHHFAYDGLDLVSETQNGAVITRETDAFGRDTGFSLGSATAFNMVSTPTVASTAFPHPCNPRNP
jgi:hypothetical protein